MVHYENHATLTHCSQIAARPSYGCRCQGLECLDVHTQSPRSPRNFGADSLPTIGRGTTAIAAISVTYLPLAPQQQVRARILAGRRVALHGCASSEAQLLCFWDPLCLRCRLACGTCHLQGILLSDPSTSIRQTTLCFRALPTEIGKSCSGGRRFSPINFLCGMVPLSICEAIIWQLCLRRECITAVHIIFQRSAYTHGHASAYI